MPRLQALVSLVCTTCCTLKKRKFTMDASHPLSAAHPSPRAPSGNSDSGISMVDRSNVDPRQGSGEASRPTSWHSVHEAPMDDQDVSSEDLLNLTPSPEKPKRKKVRTPSPSEPSRSDPAPAGRKTRVGTPSAVLPPRASSAGATTTVATRKRSGAHAPVVPDHAVCQATADTPEEHLRTLIRQQQSDHQYFNTLKGLLFPSAES